MRKRDIRIGMAVRHARSGKTLGRVTRITDALIHLDGECPIATPAELTPENVECQTCGGRKFIATGMYQYPCPDCTPENVETRNE